MKSIATLKAELAEKQKRLDVLEADKALAARIAAASEIHEKAIAAERVASKKLQKALVDAYLRAGLDLSLADHPSDSARRDLRDRLAKRIGVPSERDVWALETQYVTVAKETVDRALEAAIAAFPAYAKRQHEWRAAEGRVKQAEREVRSASSSIGRLRGEVSWETRKLIEREGLATRKAAERATGDAAKALTNARRMLLALKNGEIEMNLLDPAALAEQPRST